jgi:quinol monooxygenase YgiN/mannose-6-phosphate isomerase-like protein (cupin superfamily)
MVDLMTQASPVTRTVTFRARAGHGQALAERLLHAAALVAEAPGCELWLVHRDQDDADIIRVSEMWAGRKQRDDALGLPGVRENAAEVMRLVAEPPEVVEGHPLGGARMARGETGATVFSIPDAPDLSQDTELLGRYELGQVGEARYVREQLGALQIGLTHYRLRSGRSQGWAHRHGLVEEIYVVLSGNGRIKVDEDCFELQPLDAVRVAPGSAREMQAGRDGLEVLAFGSHVPGDGEMVSDWPAS